MSSFVNDLPAAAPEAVRRHFEVRLGVETDCWAVHEGLKAAKPDFVLVDVRGPAEFAQGHVPGAINIPYIGISDSHLVRHEQGKTFVVYGAGPHCNRADRAAFLLADCAVPVKIMIGGISGWRLEGFALDVSD